MAAWAELSEDLRARVLAAMCAQPRAAFICGAVVCRGDRRCAPVRHIAPRIVVSPRFGAKRKRDWGVGQAQRPHSGAGNRRARRALVEAA